MERITLKGHGGFSIREGWLAKGLAGVRDNPALFAKENNRGADWLGVGAVMAKAVRYWLQTAGLACTGNDSSLTALGRLILEKDPYLESPGTIWALHYNIAANREGAAVWNLFFNHFRRGSFTGQEMEERIYGELGRWCPQETIKKNLLRCDCAVLLQMYLPDGEEDPEAKEHSPLSDLFLLSPEEQGYRRMPARRELLPPLLVYYGICEYLREEAYDCAEAAKKEEGGHGETAGQGKVIVREQKEGVEVQALSEGYNSPGRLFGMGAEELEDYLDILVEWGYLRRFSDAGQRRVAVVTGMPFRREDILGAYYEEGETVPLPQAFCRKSGRSYELPVQYNQENAVTRYFEYVYMERERFLRLLSAAPLFEEHFSDGKLVVVFEETDGEAGRDGNGEKDAGFSGRDGNRKRDAGSHARDGNRRRGVGLHAWEEIRKKTAALSEERMIVLCPNVSGCGRAEGGEPDWENGEWYLFHGEDEPQECRGRRELRRYLSRFCSNYYDRTLRVNHERVNRQLPVLRQRRARGRVIESLLLGRDRSAWLTGSSLDASIYRAVLVETGIEAGGWKNLPEQLRVFLSSANGQKKPFQEIYQVLQGKHFGLRNGVIPIYLAWCLAHCPGMPVIYVGNLEQPVDAQQLGNINSCPAQYSLFVEQDTAQKQEYLLTLEKMFAGQDMAGTENRFGRLQRLLDNMRLWYQGLTLYARTGGSEALQEQHALRLLRLLQRKYINPREFFFEELGESFGTHSYQECARCVGEQKERAEGLYPALVARMRETVQGLFGEGRDISLHEAVLRWKRKSVKMAQGIVLGSHTSRILAAAEEAEADEEEILNALSYAVLGIGMEDYGRESEKQFRMGLERALEELGQAEQGDRQGTMMTFSIHYAGGEHMERRVREEKQDVRARIFYNQVMELLETVEGSLEKNQQLQVLLQILWEVAGQ